MTSLIDSNILVQTEDESLLRDVNSKALLNKNINALKEYKSRKNFKINSWTRIGYDKSSSN
jgi:hypothetical protein